MSGFPSFIPSDFDFSSDRRTSNSHNNTNNNNKNNSDNKTNADNEGSISGGISGISGIHGNGLNINTGRHSSGHQSHHAHQSHPHGTHGSNGMNGMNGMNGPHGPHGPPGLMSYPRNGSNNSMNNSHDLNGIGGQYSSHAAHSRSNSFSSHATGFSVDEDDDHPMQSMRPFARNSNSFANNSRSTGMRGYAPHQASRPRRASACISSRASSSSNYDEYPFGRQSQMRRTSFISPNGTNRLPARIHMRTQANQMRRRPPQVRRIADDVLKRCKVEFKDIKCQMDVSFYQDINKCCGSSKLRPGRVGRATWNTMEWLSNLDPIKVLRDGFESVLLGKSIICVPSVVPANTLVLPLLRPTRDVDGLVHTQAAYSFGVNLKEFVYCVVRQHYVHYPDTECKTDTDGSEYDLYVASPMYVLELQHVVERLFGGQVGAEADLGSGIISILREDERLELSLDEYAVRLNVEKHSQAVLSAMQLEMGRNVRNIDGIACALYFDDASGRKILSGLDSITAASEAYVKIDELETELLQKCGVHVVRSRLLGAVQKYYTNSFSYVYTRESTKLGLTLFSLQHVGIKYASHVMDYYDDRVNSGLDAKQARRDKTRRHVEKLYFVRTKQEESSARKVYMGRRVVRHELCAKYDLLALDVVLEHNYDCRAWETPSDVLLARLMTMSGEDARTPQTQETTQAVVASAYWNGVKYDATMDTHWIWNTLDDGVCFKLSDDDAKNEILCDLVRKRGKVQRTRAFAHLDANGKEERGPREGLFRIVLSLEIRPDDDPIIANIGRDQKQMKLLSEGLEKLLSTAAFNWSGRIGFVFLKEKELKQAKRQAILRKKKKIEAMNARYRSNRGLSSNGPNGSNGSNQSNQRNQRSRRMQTLLDSGAAPFGQRSGFAAALANNGNNNYNSRNDNNNITKNNNNNNNSSSSSSNSSSNNLNNSFGIQNKGFKQHYA